MASRRFRSRRKSEAPYGFPAGVTAAVFRQTIPFKTIIWARTNVVKMVFSSNGFKDRKGKFVRSRPPCDEFARTLAYKAAQLRSLDALYDERRRVDVSRVLKVRCEALQANEKGTLGRVARFLGVEERWLLKAATFVGEKRASEDLRDVVANYNELHTHGSRRVASSRRRISCRCSRRRRPRSSRRVHCRRSSSERSITQGLRRPAPAPCHRADVVSVAWTSTRRRQAIV